MSVYVQNMTIKKGIPWQGQWKICIQLMSLFHIFTQTWKQTKISKIKSNLCP